MPFVNTLRDQLQTLSVIAAACMSMASTSHAQVPPHPQAPAFAPNVAPAAPQSPPRYGSNNEPAKSNAPAAAASGSAPDGLTLKQLEKIEREMAVSKAKKALRDQVRADEKPEDGGMPSGIPGVSGGAGFPRMVVLPDGRRVLQSPNGGAGGLPPGAFGLAMGPDQQLSEFKVLSVVSFRGISSADIIDASNLVKTVKVGDRIGPGTVAAITADGSVSVGVPASSQQGIATQAGVSQIGKIRAPHGRKPVLTRNGQAQPPMRGDGGQLRYIVLARATDRVSGNAPQTVMGAQQPPRLDMVHAGNTGFTADATSVPMVGSPRPNGFTPPQFGPQGVPPSIGGATYAVPVGAPGFIPAPNN